MWHNNRPSIPKSCTRQDWGSAEPPTNEEIRDIYDAILQNANETGIDRRFILATVMQETHGCVRVPTTNYGHDNPGLMQSFEGSGSCNTNKWINGTLLTENGEILIPCPRKQIQLMIREGTKGVYVEGAMSLALALRTQAKASVDRHLDLSGAVKFYRAARTYNSGSVDKSGDLGKGIATHCYASDIANRLTGWVDAKSKCKLDDEKAK